MTRSCQLAQPLAAASGRLGRLQCGEDVAPCVFEVGDGADAGYLGGSNHPLSAGCLDSPRRLSQILDLDRIDVRDDGLAVKRSATLGQSPVYSWLVSGPVVISR
jgi:hypothetical protein